MTRPQNLVMGFHFNTFGSTTSVPEANVPNPTVHGPDVLEDLVTRYQALATSGLAANAYRRTATAKDAPPVP